jgi:short subunit dehydrogenase-like uncharacterized protein
MAEARPHDVVVFGATGFTGRLVCEFLARREGVDPARIALAGRSLARLEALRDELGALAPAAVHLPLVLADVERPTSLDAMARTSRVVLSTVGPYLRYGEPVVRACAEAGTHYVDLTGEGAFVDAMIESHEGRARGSGARIVPCCGFDSIPADLGAWLVVSALPEDEPVDVAAYVEIGGQHADWRGRWHSISGGTWHTAIGFLRPSEPGRARRAIARIAEKVSSGRRVSPLPGRVHRAPAPIGGWAAPLPTIDTEVVLRSAASLPRYGPDFRYGHHLSFGSLAALAAAGAGAATLFGLAQVPPLRGWLLDLKQPGEGPSPEERARNRFCLTMVGKAQTAEAMVQVRGGDPGYGETAIMVSEAALCLAHDEAALPERAGILTPVVALGDVLLARLRAAGIAFDLVARG